MSDQAVPSDPPRRDEDPPADERGRLKGAPLDGVTSDNPKTPKRRAGGEAPRPDAP